MPQGPPGDLIRSESFQCRPPAQTSRDLSPGRRCPERSDQDMAARSASPCGCLRVSNSACSRLSPQSLSHPNLLHLQTCPSQVGDNFLSLCKRKSVTPLQIPPTPQPSCQDSTGLPFDPEQAHTSLRPRRPEARARHALIAAAASSRVVSWPTLPLQPHFLSSAEARLSV